MEAVQTYYYYQQNVEELKQTQAYAEKDPVGATFLSFADKFIGNISEGIYEATHYISGEALNYNSTYYMPGKKADITRNTVANNLAEDIGGMGGEFARQSFWIGVATGDIVVELAVDAAVGAGVGVTAKFLGNAAQATGSVVTAGVHVLNGADNVGDVWRIKDGLDDSFDTIKSFNRVEDSLDAAKTVDKLEDGLDTAKTVDKLDDSLDAAKAVNQLGDATPTNSFVSFGETLPPEEAKKYLNFLEHGSTAGLTDAELGGIKHVNDALALKKVNYQDVLDLRKTNKVLEGGLKVGMNFDEVSGYLKGLDFQNMNVAKLQTQILQDAGFTNFDIKGNLADITAFKSGTIRVEEIDADLVLYRRGYPTEGTGGYGYGQWWSDSKLSIEDAREQLAILENWGNPLTGEYEMTVSQGTKAITGIAEEQSFYDDITGELLEHRGGGAKQYWINSIDESWIK